MSPELLNSSNSFNIRRLSLSDAAGFRSIRLEARGSGLASTLVERLLEYASQEVEQVQLTVVASNPRAIRFYERMGFVAYGLEKEALKDKDAYFDEILMVKFLRKTE